MRGSQTRLGSWGGLQFHSTALHLLIKFLKCVCMLAYMLYMYVGTLSLLTIFSQHRTPSLNLELMCLSAGPRDLPVSTSNMNGVLGHIWFFLCECWGFEPRPLGSHKKCSYPLSHLLAQFSNSSWRTYYVHSKKISFLNSLSRNICAQDQLSLRCRQ